MSLRHAALMVPFTFSHANQRMRVNRRQSTGVVARWASTTPISKRCTSLHRQAPTRDLHLGVRQVPSDAQHCKISQIAPGSALARIATIWAFQPFTSASRSEEIMDSRVPLSSPDCLAVQDRGWTLYKGLLPKRPEVWYSRGGCNGTRHRYVANSNPTLGTLKLESTKGSDGGRGLPWRY